MKVSETDADSIVQMPEREFAYSKLSNGDVSLAESV